MSFASRHPELATVIDGVKERRLTYLPRRRLKDLALVVIETERAGLPGMIVEAGAALGGSTAVLAAAKSPERPLRVYDVFGMIPPPGERDGADVQARYETIRSGDAEGIGGDTYYGYRGDLDVAVASNLTSFGIDLERDNVELIKGVFQDTLEIEGPVTLAHLDCDWYESVWTCLERIAPHVPPAGRFIIDDYFTWSGCREAVDDFFDRGDRQGWSYERRSALHIIRV